jgi:hypothetical protein
MPQLVKGGKYVYGWVYVRKDGSINIPNEAYLEYGFIQDEDGVITSGSKRSGGFGLTSERLLKNSILSNTFAKNQNKNSKKRKFSKVKIDKGGFITLSEHIMGDFGINIGDKLLVIRGSGLALGFIAKGPIYREAEKYSEIPLF